MAVEHYKQVKKHHFKADGAPRFKYTVDTETGRWIPTEPDLLDWEIVTKEIPDPPIVKFMEGLKKVLWMVLKGVLFIVAYGTVRGHIHSKNNKQ